MSLNKPCDINAILIEVLINGVDDLLKLIGSLNEKYPFTFQIE